MTRTRRLLSRSAPRGFRAALPIVAILLAAPAVAQEPPPIIDMHLHAFDPEEIVGETTFCANDGLVEFPPIDPAEEASMDDAMACPAPLRKAATEADNQDRHRTIMERYNIYGVLDVTRSDLAASIATADDWQASAPGRYWIAVDPYDAYSPPTTELERLAAEDRIQLFAELSPQYDGMLATDPKFAEYFALAERLDIPVGLHLGEGPPGVTRTLPGTRYSPALGRPFDLAPLLQKYPKLRLYVMHYGSPLIEEMLAMLHAYPGLYVDLAGNNWKMPRPYFHAQLKRFVDAGFSSRLMFGSDSMIWPDALPIAIDAIQSAPFLTEAQKRDILYNNAARFLRLSDEEVARHHGH